MSSNVKKYKKKKLSRGAAKESDKKKEAEENVLKERAELMIEGFDKLKLSL